MFFVLFRYKVTFRLRWLSKARFDFGFFKSCIWDIILYQMLERLISFFFGNVVFVFLGCLQPFWKFLYTTFENYWAISPKTEHMFSKTTLRTFQKCWFEHCSACLFGFNYKSCYENFLRSVSTWNNTCFLFCSDTESRFGCAGCRKLRLILGFLSRVFEISYCTKC